MNIEELKVYLETNSVESIRVRKYLPILSKKQFSENIVNICTVEKTKTTKRCDFTYRKIFQELSLVTNYTDIEIPQEVEAAIETYDYLCDVGIINYVENQIGEEFIILDKMINVGLMEVIKDKEIVESTSLSRDKIVFDNSIEGIVTKFLNQVIQKLPSSSEMSKLLTKAGKEMKNFDPEKMGYLNKALEVLKDGGIK